MQHGPALNVLHITFPTLFLHQPGGIVAHCLGYNAIQLLGMHLVAAQPLKNTVHMACYIMTGYVIVGFG